MIGTHRARVAAGAGLIAAAASVAAIMPAQAAGVPAWRLASARHFGPAGDFNGLGSVVSTGRENAWAFGSVNLNTPAKGSPIAERWNGRRWQVAALPPGLAGGVNAASAPGANDVWAVGNGYAVHFNGSRWSVARRFTGPRGRPLELTGVTAFSPANVWVFGGPGGTFHLHGTTWTKITGTGASAERASALSPGDIWAIGGKPAAAPNIIVHFNGRTWRQVTSKALNGALFTDILQLSARDVWAAGFPASGNLNAGVLLHMQGTRWTRVKIPFPAFPVALAPDGGGGIWMTAFSPRGSLAVHLSRTGVFQRFTIPRAFAVFSLARIPGAASLWAAGQGLPVGLDLRTDAVIWAFGPV